MKIVIIIYHASVKPIFLKEIIIYHWFQIQYSTAVLSDEGSASTPYWKVFIKLY